MAKKRMIVTQEEIGARRYTPEDYHGLSSLIEWLKSCQELGATEFQTFPMYEDEEDIDDILEFISFRAHKVQRETEEEEKIRRDRIAENNRKSDEFRASQTEEKQLRAMYATAARHNLTITKPEGSEDG